MPNLLAPAFDLARSVLCPTARAAWFLAAILATVSGSAVFAADSVVRPNIVLILADDK